MKILMLLDRVFPQDERVEKEILSLTKAGHEVRIATYTFEETEFQDKSLDYIIYRKKIGKWMYKFGAAVLVLPFYLNFWRRYTHDIYKEWKFEALHIHDLPMARVGVEYKKKHGILFIADQHELYSSWIVQNAHYHTPTGKVVSKLSKWEAYERKCLSEADLVCTVEEPLRAIYLENYSLQPEKVIVIPNTPQRTIYQVKSKSQSHKNLNLFYCGGMDILRGLDTVIGSLALLKEEIPEIRLVLVGRKNKHFDAQSYAESMGVGDLLEFRGWVDYRELPHEIDRSDICFFTPPTDREEIHNTIATKIYQYMARGKPVIVGSARYMKEFVEAHEIGISVDEKSSQEFADAIRKMHQNPDLYKRYAENASRLIEQYYWEETVGDLLNFYEDQKP